MGQRGGGVAEQGRGGGVGDQAQHHQQIGGWGERGEWGHDHSAIVEFSEEWEEGGPGTGTCWPDLRLHIHLTQVTKFKGGRIQTHVSVMW